jgi:RNA polymerase sigma factor (TIGR02999 family)
MDQGAEVTRWLAEWRSGDRSALERLVPALYEHLRREARSQLARERPDHTLQPTALVHEAWFDLARESRHDWESRAHFLSIAALAMRRVLVDHAQRARALKRDRARADVALGELAADDASPASDPAGNVERWIELDAALERLARVDERKARVVELRFFAGLEQREIAHVLDVAERTVERDWRLARAWLHREIAPRERAGEISPRVRGGEMASPARDGRDADDGGARAAAGSP